jgi:hypothetical protein
VKYEISLGQMGRIANREEEYSAVIYYEQLQHEMLGLFYGRPNGSRNQKGYDFS